MSEEIEVPVLIVGGGIVGLTASLLLSKQRVRSLLVERHAGTSIHPRSRGFNARVVEIFRGLGLEDAIREAGAELNLSKGIYRGSTLAEVIEPHKRGPEGSKQGGNPADAVTRIISPVRGTRGTQDIVEPVLLSEALQQPYADVQFHTECIGFEQNATGVTAEIRHRETGKRSTVRAQYLIGADGASSPVRHRLGVEMTGKGVLGHLVNILFEADLKDLVRGREFSLCVIDRPEVLGFFTSINNSNRWVFHVCYDPSKGEKAEDFTMDRCRELVKLALGLPNVDVTVKSTLPWQSAVRVATTLQCDRVFLAGDAAHHMPPWRGQGATSGIADVHNLAWKLAAVLRGEADAALLKTYDVERLPVDRRAVDVSGDAADEHGLIMWNWMTIFSILRAGLTISGYGYSYKSPTIIQDDTSQFFTIPWYPVAWFFDLNGRPGTRLPHLWVTQKGQQISTLDLCGTSFVLIVGQDGKDIWSKVATATADLLSINLPVYGIGPSSDLLDPKSAWLYLTSISAKGAILARPDGFIAWRAYEQPISPTDRLTQVMRSALCR